MEMPRKLITLLCYTGLFDTSTIQVFFLYNAANADHILLFKLGNISESTRKRFITTHRSTISALTCNSLKQLCLFPGWWACCGWLLQQLHNQENRPECFSELWTEAAFTFSCILKHLWPIKNALPTLMTVKICLKFGCSSVLSYKQQGPCSPWLPWDRSRTLN